jgi:hypothetical protein
MRGSESGNYMHSWVLEGSNEGGLKWELLDEHLSDTKLEVHSTTYTFDVTKNVYIFFI